MRPDRLHGLKKKFCFKAGDIPQNRLHVGFQPALRTEADAIRRDANSEPDHVRLHDTVYFQALLFQG